MTIRALSLLLPILTLSLAPTAAAAVAGIAPPSAELRSAKGGRGRGGRSRGGNCAQVFSECAGTYGVHQQACAAKFPRAACYFSNCHDFFAEKTALCEASRCGTDPHCACRVDVKGLAVTCDDSAARSCAGLEEAECAAKEECRSLTTCEAGGGASRRTQGWLLATGALAVLWGAAA